MKGELWGEADVSARFTQGHELGAEAEVDFGEFCVWLAGVWTRLWMFTSRWAAAMPAAT